MQDSKIGNVLFAWLAENGHSYDDDGLAAALCCNDEVVKDLARIALAVRGGALGRHNKEGSASKAQKTAKTR